METLSSASILQLLFKKLHPLLEDAAHAHKMGVDAPSLEKLHGKLVRSRIQVVDILESQAEDCLRSELKDLVLELTENLSPLGEGFQQSLILTQLCLEQAALDLLPWVGSPAEGQEPLTVAAALQLARDLSEKMPSSSWLQRMCRFLEQLQDPAFSAECRWKEVDPDIGDESFD